MGQKTHPVGYRLSVNKKWKSNWFASKNSFSNDLEEDLKIRGPGDFFGVKQHGYVKSGIINFYTDGPIIKRARVQAFKIIDDDSQLSLSKNVLIKKEFLKNYKSMLEFINIG